MQWGENDRLVVHHPSAVPLGGAWLDHFADVRPVEAGKTHLMLPRSKRGQHKAEDVLEFLLGAVTGRVATRRSGRTPSRIAPVARRCHGRADRAAWVSCLGMPSEEQLRLLPQSETDRLEWKESTRQGDEILRAVCALANDLGNSRQPGFLLIGVSKSGAVVGIDERIKDELQQQLASRLRSSKIQPVPSASVTDRRCDGKTILVVEVEPYPVPPVVEVDTRAWVRIGTSTQKANQADLQRLNERRPWNRTPFDTRPLAGTSLDDLEARTLRSAHAAEQAMDEDPESFPVFDAWLAQKQIGAVQSGRFVPNATAVLLYGKSPQDALPAAWIDCVRYTGPDRDSDPVSRRRHTGTVRDQLDVGWRWLAAQNEERPTRNEGIQFAFLPDYPEDALKELLRNMV